MEYPDLPRGEYVFEVQAVDRDLNYSETPATVTLRVHWPYERIGLVSALSLAILLVIGQTGRVLRRDRRLQAANREILEATQHKSEFLSRMSHDLRTPMNAITGYTSVLLRRVEGTHRIARLRFVGRQQGETVVRITSDSELRDRANRGSRHIRAKSYGKDG